MKRTANNQSRGPSRTRREVREHQLHRAVELIRALDPDDVGARGAERTSVRQSNGWFHKSSNTVGLAIGRKFTGGKVTARSCVCVLVRRKRAKASIPKRRRIAPITVGRKRVEVDVVELRGAILHMPLGIGPGVGLVRENPGSMCGILEDDQDGSLYVLSAAHVLAQLRSRRDATGRISLAPKNADVFDLGNTGVLKAGQTRIARFCDRSLMDFDNQFPFQSIDAGIARLDPDVRPRLDPRGVPYSGVDKPRTGDLVRAHGIAFPPESRKAGRVRLKVVEFTDPAFEYGGRGGVATVTAFAGLFVGEYDAGPGDSGGAVVRETDGALVGMHLGAVDLVLEAGGAARRFSVFVDIQRVLGRWPGFTLWTTH